MVASYKNHGFTLIELLIAMAIFAVLAAMAYFSLNSVIKQSEIIKAADVSLAQLQKTITLIERDFMQITARSIRDESGQTQPALQVLSNHSTVEFTRDGRATFGQKQSSLLRVQYRFQENKIIRKSWSMLDRATDAKFIEMTLLEDIDTFSIQFLGAAGWQSDWSGSESNTGGQDSDSTELVVFALPRVIRITIKSESFGEIKRLIPGTLL